MTKEEFDKLCWVYDNTIWDGIWQYKGNELYIEEGDIKIYTPDYLNPNQSTWKHCSVNYEDINMNDVYFKEYVDISFDTIVALIEDGIGTYEENNIPISRPTDNDDKSKIWKTK